MGDGAAKFVSEFFGLHNLGIIQIFYFGYIPYQTWNKTVSKLGQVFKM